VQLFDGERTLRDIQTAAVQQSSMLVPVPQEWVNALVLRLDDALLSGAAVPVCCSSGLSSDARSFAPPAGGPFPLHRLRPADWAGRRSPAGSLPTNCFVNLL
jgi:hypothetical protein